MDPLDATCCLQVIRHNYDVEYCSPKEAYSWAQRLVKQIFADSGQAWEGELKTVKQKKRTTNGFMFYFILEEVPRQNIEGVLIPGLKQNDCSVMRVAQEEAAELRKRSVANMQRIRTNQQSIGDVSGLKALVEDLTRMRGDGGPEGKKRKFVNGAMNVLSIAFTVGSQGLAEIRETAEE